MEGFTWVGLAAAFVLLGLGAVSLLRRRRGGPPIVGSLRFDTQGWKVRAVSATALRWRSVVEDELSLTWTGDLRMPRAADVESLRRWAREEAATQRAGLVSAEAVPSAGGTLLEIITKRREGPAWAVEGRLILPCDAGAYLITVRSIERGTTGIRDAVVTSHLVQLGELRFDDETRALGLKGWSPDARSPVPPGSEDAVKTEGSSTAIRGWFQDPYDPGWTGPAVYAVSDDERLDEAFPFDPLSRVRQVLETVRSTLVVDPSAPVRTGDWAAPLLDQSNGPRPLLSELAAGSLLLEMGRPDLAEQVLAGAVSDASGTVADDDPDLARRLLYLGLAREHQGRHADAIPDLERASRLFALSDGERALSTANARNNLGRVLVSAGRHADAEALFIEAISVFRGQDAPSGHAAIAFNGLGLIRREAGQYDEAIGLFEQALELFARQPDLGPDGPVTVLRNLALACEAKGDMTGARRAAQRSVDLQRRYADARP